MNPWVARLLLVAISSGVALVLAEGALRYTFDVYACDGRYGWVFPAGKSAVKYSRAGEFLHRVEFNSHGFRDVERSYEKPAGSYRIVVLGDSFTAGLQVQRDDLFTRVLERRLNAAAAAGRTIEVLNAGVDGYSTAQELLRYREQVTRYAPDLVLLMVYYSTDLVDNPEITGGFHHYIAGQCGRPYLQLEGAALVPVDDGRPIRPSFGGVLPALLSRSRLYTVAFGVLEPGGDEPVVSYLDFYRVRDVPREVDDAWALVEALISELAARVREDGAHFAVATIPPNFVLGQHASPLDERIHDPARVEDVFRAFFEKEGLDAIPLAEGLVAHHRREPADLYFEVDSHWTAAGHAAAAEVIERWLLERCQRLGLPVQGCTGSPGSRR